MSKLFDPDLLPVKFGYYRNGKAAALKDANLLPLARMRRRQLSQLMTPLDSATAPKRLIKADYFIQRKIDGEFTMLVFRDGEILSVNPYGTVRAGAPFHDEAAETLRAAGITSALIGGELYVRNIEGRRPRVHDVVRVARAPKSQDDLDSLCFAAFAVYDLDGEDMSAAPAETLKTLGRLFGSGDRVHPVETVEGDQKEVMARFKDWVEGDGEEGVVAVSPSAGWFKIKQRHTIDLAVVGFSEGTGDRTGMLHSLLLAVVRDDETFHLIGRTGGGFSDQERIDLLASLSERVAESRYTEVNSDKVAYQMITPGPVAEISCLDLISASSEGDPIPKMVLEWDGEKRSWDGIRRLPLASIISPQFLRLRDDKDATAEHVGLSQLTRIVEIPDAEAKAQEIALPKSEIMRRAVATKELKGKTMVRKLLMWKTNKQDVASDYPAYVLLLTDYSPNRKTPLERDIRVSSSLEQVEDYWQAWEAEQFKKGWVVQ